jgi:M6 family metalloprotease-like protein
MAGGSAADSAGLLLRRAQPGSAAGKGAPALPAEDLQILQRKVELERSLPHMLSTPKVDWSPRAARRRGWVAPATAMRNPHEREFGAAARASAQAVADTPPDTIRIAFIRVDFMHDRAGDQTTGNGRFDLSGPDTTLPPIDRAPHNRTFYQKHLEALSRYYDVQSYGRVRIEGDVWPRSEGGAYSVSDMADFGPWKFSPDIYPAAVHMFKIMFAAADSQSIALGDTIPWGSYDRFMIIHAGSDFQSDLHQDSPLDIPSFTIGVSDTDVVHVRADSIDRASFVPETASQDGFYGALNGVIAHENGHNCFGFADLYDINSGFPVVGLWSLMDSGNLAGSQVQLPNGDIIFATGLLPPSVDPFQRFFIGDALHFNEPQWGVATALENGERHADMRRIYLSSDEYLLFENRAISPGDVITLDQDSLTRVVLGPKTPDRFEYDALLPGPGVLVWHIDASVIPFSTAFRVNPDYGFNTNPARLGISVIEADGLQDLGDPGSPYILGSPRDPWYRSNHWVLSDTTQPNLIPHIGTRPHVQLTVLDDPSPTMHFRATRAWQPAGWPVRADFPPGGPLLLTVDVDGNGTREVCWAGGAVGSPDSAAIFVVKGDGKGIRGDTSAVLARLPERPRPPLAALPPDELNSTTASFAVSTYPDSGGQRVPGKVYLIDHDGNVLPGWPAVLPSAGPPISVTTPPVIAVSYPSVRIYVGASDGRVYALGLDGQIRGTSDAATAGGAVSGRLAVDTTPPGTTGSLIAFGNGRGAWVVHDDLSGTITTQPGWPRPIFGWGSSASARTSRLARPAFSNQDTIPEPEFLWLDLDGSGSPASGAKTCTVGKTVVAHVADRLWAFCANGDALPGWGNASGDTIVTGLAAGDPDGDGYAEVLTQSRRSGVAFWNQSGGPSPGWPKPSTREPFATDSPPLCLDVDGNGGSDVVAMNASGAVNAIDATNHQPDGWPLATGSLAIGSMAAGDIDGDGYLDLIAPDRAEPDSLHSEVSARFGNLYAYSLPVQERGGRALAWPMLGGDPGRSAALPSDRAPVAGAAIAGPYVGGSLKAYPNPARRRPVSFAYQLTEPADVEFRIVDASGHQVTTFRRDGRRADNLATWDPAGMPAGLYLAHVRFKSGSGEHEETIPVGVLR